MKGWIHHWYLDDGTFCTQDWFTGEIINWKVEQDVNGSVKIVQIKPRTTEAQANGNNKI